MNGFACEDFEHFVNHGEIIEKDRVPNKSLYRRNFQGDGA
jgi:hypothetical protein